MPRLLLIFVVVALCAMAIALAIEMLARRLGRADDAPSKDHPMQRLSFFLLLALMLYVGLWGAG